MAGWLQRVGGAALGMLVPPACAGCGGGLRRGEVGRLCHGCVGRIERVPEPWCACCGLPMGDGGLGGGALRCDDCRQGRAFDEARAFGLFDGYLRDLVTRLKYSGQPALGEPLGRLLADAAQEHFAVHEFEAIVPVPLHRDRLAERGFNQAYLLARPLAAAARLPVVPAVERILGGPAQVGLQGGQRKASVRGAFGLHPRHRDRIARRPVLLVDDVMTTGATLDECARMLRSAGASRVCAVTVARTP